MGKPFDDLGIYLEGFLLEVLFLDVLYKFPTTSVFVSLSCQEAVRRPDLNAEPGVQNGLSQLKSFPAMCTR